MDKADRLFVETINDLKTKLVNKTQYDLIRSSALLRQLLIDSPSLLDKVNEKYKKKILFKVNNPTQDDKKPVSQDGLVYTPMITISFIDPRDNEVNTLKYNKKKFLAYPVFDFHNHIFTIKDIIKISANVLGGVHYSKAGKQKDQLLLIANDMITMSDGASNCAFAIENIGNVTIKALEDLVNEIVLNSIAKI